MKPITRMLNDFREPAFWENTQPMFTGRSSGKEESISVEFLPYVEQLYKRNGIVFTCVMVRHMVFSEARFLWREYNDGKPSRLFSTPELGLLARPFPGGTTGELLARMEQDNSIAGNAYVVRVEGDGPTRLRRLRPDWVRIVTGTPTDDVFDYRAKVVGYIYHPKGGRVPSTPTFFTVDQVAHWSPIPDPAAQWRGISWITSVLDDIAGDKSAAAHKKKFFDRGAVTGLTISYDSSISLKDFKEYVKLIDAQHSGGENAYRTMHLGGGADPKMLGNNLRQLDFKSVIGASETRIAAASGLGAVMAQFSEGLAGSSLNVGNFTAARKRSETVLFRPLWRTAAAALESVVKPPAGAHLWYDTSDVAFLRDDALEEAGIKAKNASTVETLWRTGFTPETVVEAVATGDFSLLVHTGVESVQTQRTPGEPPPEYPADLTVNERRALDGLGPIEGGDAIYMPATNIPAIEVV